MYHFQSHTFDLNDFIASLIKAMGLNNESAEKKTALENAMKNQITNLVLNTAAIYIESDLVDEMSEKYKNENDLIFFVQELIRYSPVAQLAILAELDRFYENTLDAFHTLTR